MNRSSPNGVKESPPVKWTGRIIVKTVGNVIWVVLSGFWMALGWLVWAALFAVTIVGLPFARQCLKLARFTLWPFGRTAVRSADASALGLVGNVLWFIPGVLLAIGYAVSGAGTDVVPDRYELLEIPSAIFASLEDAPQSAFAADGPTIDCPYAGHPAAAPRFLGLI